MVKLKGWSVLKQHLALKPIKRGLEVWKGMMHKLDIFLTYLFLMYIFDLSRVEKLKIKDFFEETVRERVVAKLCSTIRISDIALSFERFFTSVSLVHTLPFFIVGTVNKYVECYWDI